MSNQQLDRKKLEKAILKKLNKSGKSPQTTSQISNKTISKQYVGRNTNNVPFSTWGNFAVYILIPLSLWWVLMRPESYNKYLMNADEKQKNTLNTAVYWMACVIALFFLGLPLISATLGLSPIDEWIPANEIVVLNWFIGLVVFCLFMVLLMPFFREPTDSNRTLYLIFSAILSIPATFLIFGVFAVSLLIVSTRNPVEGYMFFGFLFIFAFISAGLGMVNDSEYNQPTQYKVAYYIAKFIVGSGLRKGTATLSTIIVFAIFILTTLFYSWIYLLGGWQYFMNLV